MPEQHNPDIARHSGAPGHDHDRENPHNEPHPTNAAPNARHNADSPAGCPPLLHKHQRNHPSKKPAPPPASVAGRSNQNTPCATMSACPLLEQASTPSHPASPG